MRAWLVVCLVVGAATYVGGAHGAVGPYTCHDSVCWGTHGNDIIYGDWRAQTFHGKSGNDILRGKGGADTVEGNRGADRLYGGSGHDVLIGGDGNDVLHAGTGDWAFCGAGDDKVVVKGSMAGSDDTCERFVP